MAKPLLKLHNITHQYQDKVVLDKVSLEVHPKQILTLIGPNGAGKSSLVRIALGLYKPTSGSVTLDEGCRVGYLPQKIHFDPTLPLDVESFLRLTPEAADESIESALSLVKAKHLLKSSVHSLSGGELQRVLLAKAVLRKPQLLVLDEPLQGVDVSGQAELFELIKQLRDDWGCGILMVSHDLHLVMASTDEVICLHHHICCSGHPDTVSQDPAYLALFGETTALDITTYTHKHDHKH